MAHPVTTTGMLGLKFLQLSDTINRTETEAQATAKNPPEALNKSEAHSFGGTSESDSLSKNESVTFISGHP